MKKHSTPTTQSERHGNHIAAAELKSPLPVKDAVLHDDFALPGQPDPHSAGVPAHTPEWTNPQTSDPDAGVVDDAPLQSPLFGETPVEAQYSTTTDIFGPYDKTADKGEAQTNTKTATGDTNQGFTLAGKTAAQIPDAIPEPPASSGQLAVTMNANAAAGPTLSIGGDNLEQLKGRIFGNYDKWLPDGFDYNGDEVAVVTYAFPQTWQELSEYFQEYDDFSGDPFGAPTENFFAFGFDQIDAAERAMARWEDVTHIRFQYVLPNQNPDLYFYAQDFALTEDTVDSGGNSTTVDLTHGSRININMLLGFGDTAIGEPLTQTLIHEVGHSLGLSHPGNYDASDEEVPTYQTSAEYIEDTWMYSIMSYFTQAETGGTADVVDTPRTHDIYAIQQLYGVEWDVRDTNTIYGYNAWGVTGDFDFTVNETPNLTIWDGGGIDTLNLSGDNSGVTLDLNPGAFSSTHGLTYNISLAYIPDYVDPGHNAYIENAVGGNGDDSLIGNTQNNSLWGNDGIDHLHGADGDDTLRGDDDEDWLYGGNDEDTLYGGDDDDRLYGGGDNDTLSGGSGADHLYGSAGVDDLSGNDHNDLLYGGDGGDTLRGGHGNDSLYGGFGVDAYYGGSGIDSIDFTYNNADWTIHLSADLNDSVAQNFLGTSTTGGAKETISNVEDVKTGDGDDHITGSDADNTLEAGSGLNWVYGLDGDDDISGGRDRDRLYGGNGVDTIIGGDGADNLYGGDEEDTLTGGDGSDRLYGGDHIDNLFGGDDGDRLFGGDGSDILQSHDGADYLYGADGSDQLYGGNQNDRLYGGDQIDFLYGGADDDRLSGGDATDLLDGGSGNDIADYSYSNEDWTVTLILDGATSASGEKDILASIESVIMGSGDDDVYGDGNDNNLEGRGGNDILFGGGGTDGLYGGSGNDQLNGGAGEDYLIGGPGRDTAIYDTAPSSVVVDLAIVGLQNTVGAGQDGLSQMENLVGSDHADWLYGDDLKNTLYGGDGDDSLMGRAGNDQLYGGDQDDFLIGGSGSDILNGGEGIDTASYFYSPSAVYIDLNVAGWHDTLGEGLDLLNSIENVNGSNHADWLLGDENNNKLNGYDGNDALVGGDGVDELIGNNGHDALYGGLGNDVLNGGAGNDWANYNVGLSTGVSVSLNLNTQDTLGGGIDTLIEIENIWGTDYSDSLYGDASDNELRGDGGVDWLFGGSGGDTLNGGAQNDVLFGGAGNDDITGASGNDSMSGGLGFDDFIFDDNWGDDTITDFDLVRDDLDFSGVYGLNTIAQLSLTDTSKGVVVGFAGDTVRLNGISSWELDDGNFIV